ncbi:MAG: outer membrane lipid asymmetry maintenance protein MlaD [Pseudomonadota bacterium]
MANNVVETLIGAAVLTVAGGFLVYAAQTADLGGGGSSYMLEAKFRKADGLAVGTDVRVSGVKVGSVTALELDPTTFQAVASLAVSRDVQVPEDSDASIQAEGILGGNYVAITPGASEFMLEPGEEILNTQGSVSLLDLILKFGSSASGS